MHKDHPKMGGDYPFQMTSGHNRWSIHSMNITNRIMQETHRGRPHLVMNTDDAKARGIEDDEVVRVFNDVGSFITPRQAVAQRAAGPGHRLQRLGAATVPRLAGPIGHRDQA